MYVSIDIPETEHLFGVKGESLNIFKDEIQLTDHLFSEDIVFYVVGGINDSERFRVGTGSPYRSLFPINYLIFPIGCLKTRVRETLTRVFDTSKIE